MSPSLYGVNCMPKSSQSNFQLSHRATQSNFWFENEKLLVAVASLLPTIASLCCPHPLILFLSSPSLYCTDVSPSYCRGRTRESLASNTSSIMESNRRQNPALSPGHMGTTSIGPPFSFRTIPEPPHTAQPEKLQKSSTCLASITSVWPDVQTDRHQGLRWRRWIIKVMVGTIGGK